MPNTDSLPPLLWGASINKIANESGTDIQSTECWCFPDRNTREVHGLHHIRNLSPFCLCLCHINSISIHKSICIAIKEENQGPVAGLNTGPSISAICPKGSTKIVVAFVVKLFIWAQRHKTRYDILAIKLVSSQTVGYC